MNDTGLLALGLLLAFLALIFYWQAIRQRKSAGLPGGRIIYADPAEWGPVKDPLYDSDLSLTGKPDYLVQRGSQIVPVEVKTGRTPDEPYDAHIFQLAAYCLLVERCLGHRPAYGILHYPKRTFAVDYTQELESALLDVLAEMRRCERLSVVARSHEISARCDRCGFRTSCDQRL